MKEEPARNISSREVVIATSVDSGFAAPLAAALYSAAQSATGSLRIFVIGVEVPASRRHRIERVCSHSAIELVWIDGSGEHPGVFSSAQVRSRYLRVSLASLLPRDLDRVIYLDADTLVLSDLLPLFEADIGDDAVMAVRDYRIPFVSAPSGLKNYRELGLSPHAPYFNSGVMLLNLDVWRHRHIEKRVLDYYTMNSSNMTLYDQEALNAVLHDQWSELDLRWNQQSVLYRPQSMPESDFKSMCLDNAEALRSSPAIVHFTGGSKPWTYACRHPFSVVWREALQSSGWFANSAEYSMWYSGFVLGGVSRRVLDRLRRLRAAR